MHRSPETVRNIETHVLAKAPPTVSAGATEDLAAGAPNLIQHYMWFEAQALAVGRKASTTSICTLYIQNAHRPQPHSAKTRLEANTFATCETETSCSSGSSLRTPSPYMVS